LLELVDQFRGEVGERLCLLLDVLDELEILLHEVLLEFIVLFRGELVINIMEFRVH